MHTPTFLEGRTTAVCPSCGVRYGSNEGWAWVCFACGPDEQMEGLLAVLGEIAALTKPGASLCPVDGCLVLPGERCPACAVKEMKKRSRYIYTDDEHDPKRPVAWRLKGHIQVPVYEHSEVA